MMRKNFAKILLVVAIFAGIGWRSREVQAADVGYSVIPQPSPKQVDPKNTYYDLKLAPDEEEALVVTVKNNSDKELTIEVDVDKATTNSNGVVEYKNSDQHQSAKLTYDLAKLVTASTKEVKLGPDQAQDVTFKVRQPKEGFAGVIAGGINFTQETTETEASAAKSSVAIRNQYSYSIALVLHGEQDLSKHEVTAGAVKVDQANGRNKIYFPIANETAAFLNKVNVTGEVFKKGESQALFSEKVTDAQVAPNSIYEYPIGTKETPLVPGQYTAKIAVESKGEKWSFTKDFEITKEQSQTLNETAIIQKPDYSMYITIGAGIGVLLVFVILVVWYIRKKNQEIAELKKIYQEENEKH